MSLTGALPSWQSRSLPKANTNTGVFGGGGTGGTGGGGYDPAGQSTFTNKLINGFGVNSGSSGTLANASSAQQSSWAPIGSLAGNISGATSSGFSNYGPYVSPMIGELGILQSQIPYIWQNKALSGSQMQDQAAIDRDRIQLRQQLLGLDMNNANYDTGYFNNLKRLLGDERGIAGQQFNLRLEQLNADANNKMRDHKSNYVASGSIFAPQTTREYANIYANLDRSRKAATYDHQRENIGFDRQAAGLDRDLYRNQTDKQKLTLAGKQLGLDSKELETRLKYGLQQLGLDADKALAQILGQMDQLGTQADPLIAQILQLTGPMANASGQLGGYAPYGGG